MTYIFTEMKKSESFCRLLFEDKAVYVSPEKPDWIFPNQEGDALLRSMMADDQRLRPGNTNTADINLSDIKTRQVINELAGSETRSGVYQGRKNHLVLNQLTECWFHITDTCNLSCRHCMFSCSPKERQTLEITQFLSGFTQAFDLGCRTFFLTGGEPMVHPEFKQICSLILDKSAENRLVILTNGMCIDSFMPFLSRLPQDRLHLQVSLDGNQESHDRIRGNGSFEKVLSNLKDICRINSQVSVAMAVTEDNVSFMPDLVDIAAQCGVSNIHYLWMFAMGKLQDEQLVSVDRLFQHLVKADQRAAQKNITIDNIQAIEKQVFSPQGTKYDLGIAGWESLAIGPNGDIYPTPALIREPAAFCGNVREGLETVWKNSFVLSFIRNLSVADDPAYDMIPLKYIIGGGDMDHSYYNAGQFSGHDPYMELYQRIALWRISLAAPQKNTIPHPCVLLRMGDRLMSCSDVHGEVALTHSNCVLSLSALKEEVQSFYGDAAQSPNQDILNPVCYPEEEISHVPLTARIRSYGCGSPVLDADIRPGETLVDLGSGAGMECFIAARKTGKTGRVFGIDMTDQMLLVAEQSLVEVEKALKYKNVEFKRSFLEDLPLEASCADIVISNCVINLSGDKHKTFEEIFRVLKPGGRMVISDIVTDTVPLPAILNDPQLRGECIAGALTTSRLLTLIEIAGFENTRILKRFFYRQVMGHGFFSITYTAYKPEVNTGLDQGMDQTCQDVIYPGPFAAVMSDSGQILARGERRKIIWPKKEEDSFLVLDENGNAANINMENTCACYLPPEEQQSRQTTSVVPDLEKSMSGCMKCGKPLEYFHENRLMVCSMCGLEKQANAMCEAGHFVCDSCHSNDAFEIVKDICLNSRHTDMIKLLNDIRRHPVMPLHGPEHHFAVPGAIVSAYRNLGGKITDNQIISAIERGKAIPGGSCGFWGGCGAALGAGIAFGIILESNPIKTGPRQSVQQLTGNIIQALAKIKASRCCQRETWTAMIIASQMSQELLSFALPVDKHLLCDQAGMNKECPGKICPYFKPPEPFLFNRL
ncbi:MAG: methyltransferase domain-containing protein [Proteobacteria bacterium]|nr:methyltransferase domain-containing protein [Pseudomonadota bacterium]MBU1390109.1 methyltransferase domain-containing protein [Pseudomonadota bacterium]MBU1544940.1 methyltransferase domain-containing protein [Pseudomonadota bacterium]MBU2482276.1 methyltransferase domain-containing protein [Pseudomonadota bacterium]